MKWIGICANIASYRLHHFDYLKGNSSRYFVEVLSTHGRQTPEGWFWSGVTHLPHPTCYYLGTWPNYWSTTNLKIVYPHRMEINTDFSMGNIPEIQGTYLAKAEIDEFNSLEDKFGKENLIFFLWPERMPGLAYEAFFAEPHGIGAEIKHAITNMTPFYFESDIIQWLRQKYVLEARKLRFKLCVEKRYAPPPKEPQYKILDPQGAKDFPGIPINQMDLPAPTAGAGVPLPPTKRILLLTIYFSVLKVALFNGYFLRFDMEEKT